MKISVVIRRGGVNMDMKVNVLEIICLLVKERSVVSCNLTPIGSYICLYDCQRCKRTNFLIRVLCL